MPLMRYFLFVGSTLLGLFFLVDRYFPLAASKASGGDVDRSIIRIHSSHQWPAAIQIDTSLPVPKPAQAAMVADDAPPANAAHAPVRAAYAYVPRVAPKPSGRIQPRVRSTSRWSSRDTQRRLASSQPNWLPTW
jgi:hypothetical protein